MKAVGLLTLCIVVASCDSPSELEPDARFLDYTLTTVDGETLPGLTSSLPGLLLWEGGDGTMLALWRGDLVCNEDGTAEESFGFRLSDGGSEVWDPIVVELELTCEFLGNDALVFRDPATGETHNAALQEGFEGCPGLAKGLPSVELLRAGYRASLSEAELPDGLELSGPMAGEYRERGCNGVW